MPLPMQNPRASNQLRDESDIQGKLPLSLDEIVVPVQITGGDFPSHVWEGIGQGYSWGKVETGSPLAGLRAAVVLENPEGSGVVALVTHVRAFIQGSAAFTGQLYDMAITSVFGGLEVTQTQPTDTRRFPGITDREKTQLRILVRDDQPNPLTQPPWSIALGAPVDQFAEVIQEVDVVLVPGTALIVVSRFIDQEVKCGFRWNERPARTAELARLSQG